MLTRFSRRPLVLAGIVAVLSLLAVPSARADLTWTRATGWQITGAADAGLTGAKGKAALDLMNKARTQEEAHHNHSAINTYEKVGAKYQGSVYAAEAFFRAGKLCIADKQYYRGFADFQTVLRRYPNTQRFSDVIGEQYRIAAMLMDGSHNWFWGWLPGWTNRTRGVEYMEVIVLNAPYSDYAPLALMDAARGNQQEKNTEEAIDSLDRLVNTYPQSVLAPVAYLKLGDLHASLSAGPKYDQASTKEAMTYYEDFMILFPGDTNVAHAAEGVDKMKTTLANSKIYIGDYFFYKRYNFEAAKVFYNEAITAYPDSSPAKVAKKRLASLDVAIQKNTIKPGQPVKKRFWLF